MNPEVERAWLHVERAVGKRYPKLLRRLQEPVKEMSDKELSQELYRLARDIEECKGLHYLRQYSRLR